MKKMLQGRHRAHPALYLIVRRYASTGNTTETQAISSSSSSWIGRLTGVSKTEVESTMQSHSVQYSRGENKALDPPLPPYARTLVANNMSAEPGGSMESLRQRLLNSPNKRGYRGLAYDAEDIRAHGESEVGGATGGRAKDQDSYFKSMGQPLFLLFCNVVVVGASTIYSLTCHSCYLHDIEQNRKKYYGYTEDDLSVVQEGDVSGALAEYLGIPSDPRIYTNNRGVASNDFASDAMLHDGREKGTLLYRREEHSTNYNPDLAYQPNVSPVPLRMLAEHERSAIGASYLPNEEVVHIDKKSGLIRYSDGTRANTLNKEEVNQRLGDYTVDREMLSGVASLLREQNEKRARYTHHF